MVRFLSTHLNTISASSAGGPPATVGSGPVVAVGTAPSRGRHLVFVSLLDALVPHLYINRYIVVKYSVLHKNDIYKKKLKN
jgi:hypothetical protein